MSTVAWDGDGLVVFADQVRELGGSERVLSALLARYPRAELIAGDFQTTNVTAGVPNPLLDRARLVRLGRKRRHFLGPLYARRLARVAAPPADVYLLFAHAGWSCGVDTPVGVPRLGYVAGPPRFLYGHTREYLRDYPRLIRPLLRAAVPLLRRRWRSLVGRCDRVITHSRASQEALRRLHGFDSDIIYPPVRTGYFTPSDAAREHVITVGRVVDHKRLEDVVTALAGGESKLVVVGGGSRLDRLRERAAANVRFTGFVADDELRELYRASTVLVCPSVEEFGIVMVEALSCGVPVIAPRSGGALEIVEDGKTGLLLDRATPEEIRAAVERIHELQIDPADCREAALRFSDERYALEIASLIDRERAQRLASDDHLGQGDRRFGQELAHVLPGS